MAAALLLLLGGCGSIAVRAPEAGSAGTLLIVGGGLDNDTAAVWQRFVQLAIARGPGRAVVVTAATGPQEVEATDKTEALRTWAPELPVEVVRRETSTADTVAAIDRATALLFTGGDQQRITARYRPDGGSSPERDAMVRLLQRGGVIAGCSAGCAMMGRQMFEGGRSAQALGLPPAEPVEGEPPALGPRLGAGMGFLPWGLTDSHFFERDRVGRLVPGLLASGERFGLGVGEDAAIEVDLATGTVVGLTPSESLLVDAAHARNVGASWTGLGARVLGQGDRVLLRDASPSPPPAPLAPDVGREIPVVEPGQNRQLAAWRLFRQASRPGAGVLRLQCDGWAVRACAAPNGGTVFAIDVLR
ncbi:MAG: cyanophycinase [Planctomycetota bacterium]